MRGAHIGKAVCLAILFIFFFAGGPRALCAQKATAGDPSIIRYQQHRRAFLERQKQAAQRLQRAVSDLESRATQLQRQISGRTDELARLNQAIAHQQHRMATIRRLQAAISLFLFPIAASASQGLAFIFGAWAGAANLLIIVLALTCINLFLYVVIAQKPFFGKYRIALIAALVAFITAIALPLFAAENPTKTEQVMEQLKFAEKVLSLSDHQRFIAILESKVSDWIELPDLASGDPLLKVFRKVKIDSPQYYFTLAALYMHEGKTGKAIDAIEKIVNRGHLAPGEPGNTIAVDAIEFLIRQNQTELAGRAVETLASGIDDVTTLLQLAEFLRKSGMQASEEKVLGYAVDRARSVKELTELSGYLFKKGENEKGYAALNRALERVRSVEGLMRVARMAIRVQNDAIVEQVILKTRMIRDFRERVKLTDLFMEHGRKEEAIAVFSEMIREVKSVTPDRIKKLLFLIDAALKRDFLPQAIKATERLFLYLGPRGYSYTIESADTLKAAKGVPSPEEITLPQFFGMLNEELGFTGKAEDIYIRNVLDSLKRILQSYGYQLPASLNDYYLLGRVWVKEKRGDRIARLDGVYTIIEEQFLKRQTAKNDSLLKELKKQLQGLEDRQKKLLAEIREKETRLKAVTRESVLRSISAAASILLLVGILAGCLILSVRFAKSLNRQKTFGFITKFLETTGWVRVFSVLGAPSGLISVFVAQLFQIIQGVHENGLNALRQQAIASSVPRAWPELEAAREKAAKKMQNQEPPENETREI